MKVKRIVANIETADPGAVARFYEDVLGLDLLMDHGWIATYGTQDTMPIQVSFASEGGSGTPVPGLSVEVDDVCALVRLNHEGRMRFVDGVAEIVPGIAVHKVGGHTAGMQVVTVETARGRAVVASDASHYYRNFEERIPFTTLHDIPGTYAAFDRLRELASAPELILPGHDPLVHASPGVPVRVGMVHPVLIP